MRRLVFAFALLVLASVSAIASGETMRATPLHAAAAADDVDAIGRLLSQGAAIDARDGAGATPLLV
ncbi:ankyrin repeat domain-containing protein, partial [Mesorhizobium sp. M2C.T.Ca.TU.009.01.2.1]